MLFLTVSVGEIQIKLKFMLFLYYILFIIFNCDNFYLSKTQMRLHHSINTPCRKED